MKLLPLVLVAAACALTVLPSASGAALVPTADVYAAYGAFVSPVAPLSSGGILYFHNIDIAQIHHPNAIDGSFAMHLNPGDSYAVVIDKPAGSVIPYRCLHHPYMGGVIVVV